ASCGAFNNKKGIFTLKNGSQQSCGVLNPFFLNKNFTKVKVDFKKSRTKIKTLLKKSNTNLLTQSFPL
ncbi:hypothetical protein J4232_00615, partial [Candidatus Woesearchaeota archaeon]|nr:hypothetical protein [Candidatus Woesearchaeota archaeon]